ncbi:hypothetical protein ACIPL1_17765 [Pseudomonas sp. NPDC090202]|uniref:hypothetical protein n=1 Tax=unclassified Pseudomonas TaxID=196821 RepID=UPI00381C4B7D
MRTLPGRFCTKHLGLLTNLFKFAVAKRLAEQSVPGPTLPRREEEKKRRRPAIEGGQKMTKEIQYSEVGTGLAP